MLGRDDAGIGLGFASQQVSGLSHVALRHHARKVPALRAKIVACLIRLIVFGAYGRRAHHPGHLAVGANDLAVDRVRRKVSEAAAFGQTTHADAAEAAPLRERAAECQPLNQRTLAVLPRSEPQAHGAFRRAIVVIGKQALAVECADLILERALINGTQSHQAGTAAGRKIVDERALNEILVGVLTKLFLTERLLELPEAKLQLINPMNVEVEVTQERAGCIGEIAFDLELIVTRQLAFERNTGAANQESVWRMIARPVAAIVEMREAGYSSHEITVGASQESMIVIPPREYGGFFTRLRIFLRRRSGRPAMVSLNRFGRGQRRRRSAISRRRWR